MTFSTREKHLRAWSNWRRGAAPILNVDDANTFPLHGLRATSRQKLPRRLGDGAIRCLHRFRLPCHLYQGFRNCATISGRVTISSDRLYPRYRFQTCSRGRWASDIFPFWETVSRLSAPAALSTGNRRANVSPPPTNAKRNNERGGCAQGLRICFASPDQELTE